MNMLDSRAVPCLMLILGLVVCQDGVFDLSMESSGSGSGDGEIVAITKAPSTKRIFTRQPDDTVDESGSGDDEDAKLNVTTKPSSTSSSTTNVIFVEPDDTEDFSGSGSGLVGKETTATPKYTTGKKTKAIVSTKGNNLASTRNTNVPSTKATTTMGNKLPTVLVETTNLKTTKRPKETAGPNDVEDQKNPGNDAGIDGIETIRSTTVSPKQSETTTLSNRILGRDLITDLIRNAAAQKSTKGQVKKQGLSFVTGIIIGVVVGAVLAILIILFLVYRLRKKDEGSYSLEEPITGYTKQEPGSPTSGKEYFA